MNARSSLFILIASILLIGAYFFPLWSITLEAPQYPEGLRLDIWLFTISGNSDNILQNINILNHYIGMKMIEPDSIRELIIFPYIVAALIAFGVLVAILKKKALLWVWVIAFTIFGIGAVYDFYLWEYDYGHDLNPNAPIKVPGMVYQPPLFGEKWLLNFKAISYPSIGAFFMLASISLGILALLNENIRQKKIWLNIL